MKASPERFIEVFNEAKSLGEGRARDRFLSEACRDDPELEQQVLSLLRSHEDAGDFLQQAAFVPSAPIAPEQPGDRIGRYKLLEQIGEGGCGVVYMAEQEEPIRRRVALKVIKLGMDTKTVMARFEAERQALAMMDHPNIAKVFDAGATDTGRPYFVMELVRGIRITDFCDQNKLSTTERLKLFSQVCHAIQHAHQKGIIHRDIKPSNILVTVSEPGAPGCPRVIDFGIAKATGGQRLSDQTIFTAFEQFIGTPAYMSPEQAMMTSLDIDTRTDIYALGVLLYELLTGRTPFDAEELMALGLDAMRRIIREQEPARPSTRVSTMRAPDLTAVARHRHAEPARLSTLLRGDLDWIVMKCLEKDRDRRYETADGLAMDVQRHLGGQPVLACPPSKVYRFRKFARRNKVALAVASAIALAILLAVAGLVISNRLISRARDDKEAALTKAVEEKARADHNLSKAREAVKEFLLKASESPLLRGGDFQPLRKELLETAIPFYEDFVRQDQEDSDLEFERGRAYDDLGFLRESIGDQVQALADFGAAENIFRSLAERFPDMSEYRLRLAESYNSRGGVLKDLGRLDEAEREFREGLAVTAPLLSTPGTQTESLEYLARIQGNLGTLMRDSGRLSEAETLLREAVTMREKLLGQKPDSLPLRGQLATSWINLGTVLRSRHEDGEAEKAFKSALKIADIEPDASAEVDLPLRVRIQHLRAQAWNNLGTMHNAASRFREAEESFRESLAIKESLATTFPSIPQHRQELASTLNNLGTAVSSLGRKQEARALYEKAVLIYEALAAEFPADPHHAVALAGTYSNLGRVIADQGELEESLSWVTQAIELLEAALRRDQRVAKVRESLLSASWTRAMTLCGLERFSEAPVDWSRAIEMDDGRYHQQLRLRRASNLLHLGNDVGASKDAGAIADFATATAEDIYDAASIYSHCARLASGSAERADSYAVTSVRLLRLALEVGYDGVERIKTHEDLDPLRSREDFQQLIRELEAGPIGPNGERSK